MKDDERHAKISDALQEFRQNLESNLDLSGRVDEVREELRQLTARFVEHTLTDAEDKAEILREIQANPERVAERIMKALRRRGDDTPLPPSIRPRASREISAVGETSSADLIVSSSTQSSAPPSPPPAKTPAGPSAIDDITGIGTRARRLWRRLHPLVQTAIFGTLVAVVTSVLWALGCQGWAQKLNEIKLEVPPPPHDLGMAHDLVTERGKPAPEPQKPKKPGSPKPRPKPSDGDAQVDPLRQPEERRHIHCQPGLKPLDPLLCPRDAKPRQPGEW